MKLLATYVFCAVLISVRADILQLFGRRDTMDYNPDTAKILKCYDVTCPSGTTACSQVKKTSNNLETLTTTYKCENERGEVLHSETEETENPYPGVKIQSFSFSGVYHISNFGISNLGDTRYPGIETFGNGFRNPSAASSTPRYITNNDVDRYNYERNKYNTNDLNSQVETFDK